MVARFPAPRRPGGRASPTRAVAKARATGAVRSRLRRVRVVLAIAVALPALACGRGPSSPPQPVADPTAPVDALVGDRAAYLATAETRVTVARPEGPVTLRDRRTLRREANGDFAVEVARAHQGSEPGDTDESFRAIRVGKDYFTRGSGGPFVRWDDARDEPRQAAESVLQGTRDLLEIAIRCSPPAGDGPVRAFSLAPDACTASATAAGAPFSANVTRLEGEVRREGSRTASVRMVLGMDVEAGGRRAFVTVEHLLAFSDTPDGDAPAAPGDFVPARRARPVAMARRVLEGLVDAFGPGAPEVLRKVPGNER